MAAGRGLAGAQAHLRDPADHAGSWSAAASSSAPVAAASPRCTSRAPARSWAPRSSSTRTARARCWRASSDADLFVMATDVDAVYADWGTPHSEPIGRVTAAELGATELRGGLDGTQGRGRRGLRASAPARRRRSARSRTSASSWPAPGARTSSPAERRRHQAAPRTARPPTLPESLLAIGILIVLVLTTVLLFGTDATGGPLQVALLLSAVGAGLLALRLGHTTATRQRSGRRGCLVRDGSDLHPARRRRAHRHLEHGGHDPDGRVLRHRPASAERVLPLRRSSSAGWWGWPSAARGRPRPRWASPWWRWRR